MAELGAPSDLFRAYDYTALRVYSRELFKMQDLTIIEYKVGQKEGRQIKVDVGTWRNAHLRIRRYEKRVRKNEVALNICYYFLATLLGLCFNFESGEKRALMQAWSNFFYLI